MAMQCRRAVRIGVVHGCIDGVDLFLVLQTQSFNEYKTRRDELLRTDLTVDQVIAKLDGLYAEPGNQTSSICTAVLSAMHPPTAR
jgi:hypothetical protein